jgi:mono/diheme cytochrome c family protein
VNWRAAGGRAGRMLVGSAFRTISLGITLGLSAAILLTAQEPAGGRGGGAGPAQGPGRGGVPAGQAPVARSPVVDQAAHDRGRALWASHCIDCHGSQARGSDTGPNIIRSRVVNFDRSAAEAGSVLGPFLKAGHPTQSQKPSASFTDPEVVALANFLRQRVNDTMRGSPLFTVGDIVVGDPQAGEAYFKGEGGCTTCHTATDRNLAGIATRIPEPVDLQQRMLFPGGGGRGRGGRGGARGGPPGAAPGTAPPVGGGPAGAAAAAAAAAPPPPATPPVDRNAITVTITQASGAPISGALVAESDFYVTLREPDGTVRVVRRTPGMKVTKNNPMQAHIDLLDRVSDKQIHDLVAYLETLK